MNGWACSDQAQTDCTDVASISNPHAAQIQGDLHAADHQMEEQADPLKTYPIVSVGLAYSFDARGARVR